MLLFVLFFTQLNMCSVNDLADIITKLTDSEVFSERQFAKITSSRKQETNMLRRVLPYN